ncbi:DUF4440 domain-containing protein [Sphingomonas aracearum]|uniref:DUF4440 domain-containing protein n=2 Tax=Sphingomonas aracearum TaxID=2283317 RepID=A0A369W5M9_9SPHN|nr:DUF4440 domain-containing protein [Sphingomonas aracearum]
MMAFWAAVAVAAAPVASDRQTIELAMQATAAAWSKGDLDGFLRIYSEDPATSFVTSTGVIRGKAAMRGMYLKAYSFDDPAKRGALSFATLEFRPLGRDKALLISRYTLRYPDAKTATGITSVVFSREKAGWRIVADHSS